MSSFRPPPLNLSTPEQAEMTRDAEMVDPKVIGYTREFARLPNHIPRTEYKELPYDEAIAHGHKEIKDGNHVFINRSTVHHINDTIVKTYMFFPRNNANESVQDAVEFLHRFVGNEVFWQEQTRAFLAGNKMDGIQLITPRVLSVSFDVDAESAKAQITMEHIDVIDQPVEVSIIANIDRWLQSAGIWHNDFHPGNIKYTRDGRIAILDYGSSGAKYGARVGGKRKRKTKRKPKRKNVRTRHSK